MPRRGFQRLPRLDEKEFAPVVWHLDPIRAQAMLAEAEPLEFLRGLGIALQSLHDDPDAWRQAAQAVAVSPQRLTLSPEGSLALVMHFISIASARFPQQLASAAFVSLVANLDAMDQLVLSPQQQAKLSRFGEAAVRAASASLPCDGGSFFDLPKADRRIAFQHYMNRLIDLAMALDMGLHEDDCYQFILELTGHTDYAGRFDVVTDADWPAMARVSMGGPMGLAYGSRAEFLACAAASSPAPHDYANEQFVMAIEAGAHEILHACQNSLVDRSAFARDRTFDSDEQYRESLGTLISACVTDLAYTVNALPQGDLVLRSIWMPLEERPAWFLSWATREHLRQFTGFEAGVRDAARMTDPQELDAVARLLGIRPRGVVTVHAHGTGFAVQTEHVTRLSAQEAAALDQRAGELMARSREARQAKPGA